MATDDTVLATARLVLRAIQDHDVPHLALLWQDRVVRQHLGGAIDPGTAESKAVRLVRRPGCFAVTLREGGVPIGLATLVPGHGERAELSYMFDPQWWGAGMASEATTRIVRHGFDDLRLPRLIAVTQAANVRSTRLLEVIGMTAEQEFAEFDELQALYSIHAARTAEGE